MNSKFSKAFTLENLNWLKDVIDFDELNVLVEVSVTQAEFNQYLVHLQLFWP